MALNKRTAAHAFQHNLSAHNLMTNSLLDKSRSQKTFGTHATTLGYWRSFARLIGIHEVIPSSGNSRDNRPITLHVMKTFFSHLALTLSNDKRVVGMAKPPTIADHVTRVVHLHKLIDFQLDDTGIIAYTIAQMTQGREEQFHDMGVALHNPKRHASNQSLMDSMIRLPWNKDECFT